MPEEEVRTAWWGLGIGIRNVMWEVIPPLWPRDEVTVVMRYRDRWGHRWIFGNPVSSELAKDAPTFLLEMLWAGFRISLDRRYDDPFVFWPRGIGRGRWAPEEE
jgi:hypothetical protein